MDPGLIGGIVGALAGFAGAAVGTWFSIRNTHWPRERAFMVRVSAAAWVLVTAFLAALLMLPPPYRWLLWGPYGIGLALSVAWANHRQAAIRSEEAAAGAAAPASATRNGGR